MFKQATVSKYLINKMRHLATRQKIVTTNLANAATPGYKAMRLKDKSFKQLIGTEQKKASMGLSSTSSQHMAGAKSSSQMANETYREKSKDIEISGNSVKPEEELMLLDKTGTEYYAAATAYKKYMKLFKTALGK